MLSTLLSAMPGFSDLPAALRSSKSRLFKTSAVCIVCLIYHNRLNVINICSILPNIYVVTFINFGRKRLGQKSFKKLVLLLGDLKTQKNHSEINNA